MPKEKKLLSIEDAQIMFRNFSGKESKFNRAGDRNFAVIIPEKMVKKLSDDGWNIKETKPRDPADDPRHYINVAVRYGNRPPKIFMIAGKSKPVLLDETNVGSLDFADIINVDLTINPSYWEVSGKTGIKAYCNTMYVTIEDDPFRKKYEVVEDIDDDDIPF